MNKQPNTQKTSKPELVVKCPSCNKSVAWQLSKHKPFCSERCKMLDLGAWANEERSIPEENLTDEAT